MKKIKIAMLGTGHDHATAAISTLKLQKDIYDFVGYAVVDGDEEVYNASQWAYEGAKKMTVEELLNYPDLEAVCIETEDRALTKYAIMAAEKGLHIQMDKPGGIDDDEFDRLIDIVKEKQLVFHVGYMYRYNPVVLKLKEDIAAGKLGEIYSVEAHMSCMHYAEKRKWLSNYPGGMLYYLGCHLIDLVYSIQGEPEEVIPLSTCTGMDDFTTEDFGMAVMKYKNGLSFVKSAAWEYGGFLRRQLVVCGTKGTVEVKPFERLGGELEGVFSVQQTGVREVFDKDWHAAGEYHETEPYGRYDAMYRAFAEYVRGEKVNPFDYEYERRLHKLLLKACGK